MPEYRLPDGKILTVIVNITPEEKQQLRTQLSGLYPDHYQPYKEEEEK